MCGFDPRISEWSSADATCPLAYASSNRTPTTLTDVGLTGHFISGEGQTGEASCPVAISMPVLTLKEKQWLDQEMETVEDIATQVAFEIEPVMFENYKRYYREYPTYVESLF